MNHGAHPLRMRIATNFVQRARGLLGRAPLRENDALLIPGCHAVHTCGMSYPIDVVFLDVTGRVLAVTTGLAPWRYSGRRHASAVLELAAGSATRLGFVPGARLCAIANSAHGP